MKDVSFFLLKNSIGAKMRRGFKSSCNGNGSTSTLNQKDHKMEPDTCKVEITPRVGSPLSPTLEEMILRLEMEEEMARRSKISDCYCNGNENNDGIGSFLPGRMSCVNSSDILRTARKALNQYPRFSLDGKDAMYRSSFRRRHGGSADERSSFCGTVGRGSCLPATVAGERVVWCKTGVVAKLMGLDVIPVPARGKTGRGRLCCLMRREGLKNINVCDDAFRRDSYSGGGLPTLRFP